MSKHPFFGTCDRSGSLAAAVETAIANRPDPSTCGHWSLYRRVVAPHAYECERCGLHVFPAAAPEPSPDGGMR